MTADVFVNAARSAVKDAIVAAGVPYSDALAEMRS